MNHKFILQFYIKGNLKHPKKYNIGRFEACNFNYPNIDVVFTTEARSDEKIYDIIHEMNSYTQEKAYELPEKRLNIKFLYLDSIVYKDKNITVADEYKKNKILNLETNMFYIESNGAGARLEISLE
jgi:hypothetical protein